MRTYGLIAAGLAVGLTGVALGYTVATGPWRDGVQIARAAEPSAAPDRPAGEQKPLYYRNPMGAPDTSPVPKKDSMGMDYIPVYADEASDRNTVRVSLDKVQRSGVRTEPAEMRSVARSVHAPGTVKIDERRLQSVTLRAEGYIEKLYANATGQAVKKGEPLFRVYSPAIVSAQVDYRISLGARGGRGADAQRGHDVDGAFQRLRNLEVPEAHIEALQREGAMPMSLDWPSPVTGTVLDKQAIEGQRVQAGQEMFRIADLSRLWVIAEVPEQDLEIIRVGDPAKIVLRAFPSDTIEAKVDFIYPDINPATRTAKVRLEIDNARGLYRADMYADVTIAAGSDREPKITVPASALIDNGSRRVVLVERGEGRFEPREVKTGRRGQDGYVEVTEGLNAGEKVVATGNFLIDAESNLKAALEGFKPGAPSGPEAAPAPAAQSETPATAESRP